MNFIINDMNYSRYLSSIVNDNEQLICNDFNQIVRPNLNISGGTRISPLNVAISNSDEIDELYYHPNSMPSTPINNSLDNQLIRYAERQVAMAQILSMSFDDFMMSMVNGFNEPRFSRAVPGDVDYKNMLHEYQGDTKIMTAYLNREKLRMMSPADFYRKYIHY